MKQEKVENESHESQIKKLQTYLLDAKSQEDKGEGIQKLLNERESVIQIKKKKLKIPSTKLIHASELAELEKEKEGLGGELTSCKAKLLKFAEKRNSGNKTWLF